jgi:hypothetical protein
MSSEQFRVLPEHIALLRAASVGWEDCEFGAPAIDCKRPYGCSSVYGSMVEVLTKAGLWKGAQPDDHGQLEHDDYERLYQLHKETETVLQIILYTGTMTTGLYETPQYRSRWVRVGD